jgi:transposase InsO family protein
MPWNDGSPVSLRHEFLMLATQEGVNFSVLCRGFGISRKTGYKWLQRFAAQGRSGLAEHSRRPQHTPGRTPAALEAAVVALRQAHPAWGGRKLHRRLQDQGYRAVPAPSTITGILQRQGLIKAAEARKHHAWQRFEHDAPNRLWQMDFKGWIALDRGRCHPLTVLDDHSRFNVVLHACPDEQGPTVQHALTGAFRRYGLPERMTMDNGAPWGSLATPPLTAVTVWLLRVGVEVSHSRPAHPQTQGKDERFHRTLEAEVLHGQHFRDLAHCQAQFDRWRACYNLERPHDALALAVPASRYHPSPRSFPEPLPAIEYAPVDIVRRVQSKGELHYQGRVFRVSQALRGYPVALRPTTCEGRLTVYFCRHVVREIDLRLPSEH